MEEIQSRKAAHLARMVAAAEIPLRTGLHTALQTSHCTKRNFAAADLVSNAICPGVASFLEDAAANGARLAMLAGTCSSPQVIRCSTLGCSRGAYAASPVRLNLIFACTKESPLLSFDDKVSPTR